MGTNLAQQGFFSVLRWRADPDRDEARNVAVILVDAVGKIGGVKSAPLSTISSRLHEQGLLDAVLAGLGQRFSSEVKPDLNALQELHASLQHSLYVTEPKAVAVADSDTVLNALYRAYVAPRTGGSRTLTKGAVLDRTVDILRKRGLDLRRGEYVDNFLFDATIRAPGRNLIVLEVLSFATARQDWAPIEHDAGHFLYALERVEARGTAVVQPPLEHSSSPAYASHDRVQRWFREQRVTPIVFDDLASSKGADILLETYGR